MPSAVERQTVTPPTLARELGVCEDTVRLWIRNKELKAFNLAESADMQPRWRIHRNDIEEFLRRRANVVADPPKATRRKPAGEDFDRFDYS